MSAVRTNLIKDLFFKFLFKLNIALIFSAIILAGYLIFGITRSYYHFSLSKEHFRNLAFDSVNISGSSDEKIPVFEEGIFKQRSLFAYSGKGEMPESSEVPKLLGIISVEGQRAAMIRDVEKDIDYHCVGGEMIGEFKVKVILEDRVILESKGGTLELMP